MTFEGIAESFHLKNLKEMRAKFASQFFPINGTFMLHLFALIFLLFAHQWDSRVCLAHRLPGDENA